VILEPSDNDRAALADVLRNHVEDNQTHPPHYRDCVILKPWGYEFELAENEHGALWVLHVIAARATSLHCHRYKTASFIPLSDGFQIVTLGGVIVLPRGAELVAKPGVFHSVWNTAVTDGELFEYETPSDKRDLWRAQDAWGREKDGYEGETHIVRENLAQYGHCRFSEEAFAPFGVPHTIDVSAGCVIVRRLEDA